MIFLPRTPPRSDATWSPVATKTDPLLASQDVTLPEVLRAIRKYIKPLFDPSRSIGSVTCGPGKDSELVADFKGAGYDVSSQTFA